MNLYLKMLGLVLGLIGWGLILWQNWIIGIGVLLAMWGNNLSNKP